MGEFALTQVLDRPRSGRILFENIIRENLDLGRPDQVQLIFARRVTKRSRVVLSGGLHPHYGAAVKTNLQFLDAALVALQADPEQNEDLVAQIDRAVS